MSTSASGRKAEPRSRSQRFVAASGELGDTAKLPWPVRIVAEMIQYLIALMLVAFAKGIELTFKKQKKMKRKARGTATADSSGDEVPTVKKVS